MRNTLIEAEVVRFGPNRSIAAHGSARQKGQYRQIYSGRAFPLCPGSSDVDLFRYREGIIHLYAKVSDGAFDLGMAEQELHSPQIASSPVDQRRLCSPKRMRAEELVGPAQCWQSILKEAASIAALLCTVQSRVDP